MSNRAVPSLDERVLLLVISFILPTYIITISKADLKMSDQISTQDQNILLPQLSSNLSTHIYEVKNSKVKVVISLVTQHGLES